MNDASAQGSEASTCPTEQPGDGCEPVELEGSGGRAATNSPSVITPVPKGSDATAATSSTSVAPDKPKGSGNDSSEAKQTNSHHGIHWPSPISMFSFFLLGVIFSVSHHLYYNSRDGLLVKNADSQQRNLRYGTTFAFLVQVSLIFSVYIAYTQCLWMTLKGTTATVDCLDAAFSATPISLLNREMLRKITVGAFIIFIATCLPIPSLVTPTTLSVNPGLSESVIVANVTALDMSTIDPSRGINQPTRFAYYVPSSSSNSSNGSGSSSSNGSETLLGPRTIISRLSVATATTGQILPIIPPFANSSYQLKFYGPIVKCEDANSSVANAIDHLLQAQISTPQGANVEGGNAYFAFIPDLSMFENGSADSGFDKSAIIGNRVEQPANASNQLWMVFLRYTNGSSCLNPANTSPHHLVCQLWNASYNVNMFFEEGSQNITDSGTQLLNTVDYPTVNLSAPSDLTQHAYSAFMWAFSDQLIGSMGMYTLFNGSATTKFSEINTQIRHTSLVGSSDLDVFFDMHRTWIYGTPNCTISNQRQRDINLARGLPLDVLIKELSFNTTLSLLSSNLLSPFIATNVSITKSVNRYAYHSSILWISYGLAIFFALLANILGAFAYWRNGVSHDRSFSSILSATRDPGLEEPFETPDSLGKLPLPIEVRKMELKFERAEKGGLGLKRVK